MQRQLFREKNSAAYFDFAFRRSIAVKVQERGQAYG